MKVTNLLVMMMAVFFFSSCETEVDKTLPQLGQNGPKFMLNYQIPSPGASENTRVNMPAEPGESLLNSLHLLFFEHSTGGTGKYINFYKVPEDKIPNSISGMIEVDIQGKEGLNNSSSYIILLIANGDDYVKEGNMSDWLETLDNTLTEDDVINNSMTSFIVAPEDEIPVEAWDEDQIMIKQNNLLMTTRAEKLSDQEMVSVKMTRAMSRIDVEVKADNCTLKTVSVWNVFPSTTLWPSNFNDYSSETRRIKRFYGKYAEDNKLIGGIYAFENYVTKPEQNDRMTTCVILGIESEGTISYYRVNIHSENKIQTLKRNHAYKVVVQRVRQKGANTELDAFGDSRFLLDLRINDWIVDENGSVQYDGENVLALPTTNMVFLPEGGTRVDNIFTLGAGYTLVMGQKDLPYGITAELEGNTLTVKAAPSNQDRSGFIELRFGNLVGIINISQTGLIEQFLDLSTYTIPEFGYKEWNSGTAEPILVSSSGSWTATIYNGPYFSFQSGNASMITKQGTNGDAFTLVTSSINDQPGPRYSFVHITLDEFPDISRVLVLTQNGTGGIDLSPANSSVAFNAFGDYVGNVPTFNVSVNPGAEWEIVKLGANPGQFTSDVMSSVGPGVFTITAERNILNTEQSATFRIRLKDLPGVFKEITITQSKHSLSLNPETVAEIPAAGGNSGLITVTSTDNWKATIVAQNGSAYFGNISGTTTITGNPGGNFIVTLDPTTAPGVAPIITVTVEIEGTEISRTLTITQTAFPARTLYAQSYNAAAGWWGDTWNHVNTETRYFTHFRDILKNPSYFGPTGVVYTGNSSVQYSGRSTSPLSNTCIANINAGVYAADYTKWKNWLTGDERNFAIVCTELIRFESRGFLRLFDPTFDIDGTSIYPASGIPRYASEAKTWCESQNRGAALWDYLTKTGPFKKANGTDVNINNIKYINGDGHNTVISSWPSTTIPIIMTNGKVDVGVDPVHRIIVIGDFELFGSMGGGNGHQPYSSLSEDSQVFLKNLIAYVVNVAMYGDAFNDQFK